MTEIWNALFHPILPYTSTEKHSFITIMPNRSFLLCIGTFFMVQEKQKNWKRNGWIIDLTQSLNAEHGAKQKKMDYLARRNAQQTILIIAYCPDALFNYSNKIDFLCVTGFNSIHCLEWTSWWCDHCLCRQDHFVHFYRRTNFDSIGSVRSMAIDFLT